MHHSQSENLHLSWSWWQELHSSQQFIMTLSDLRVDSPPALDTRSSWPLRVLLRFFYTSSHHWAFRSESRFSSSSHHPSLTRSIRFESRLTPQHTSLLGANHFWENRSTSSDQPIRFEGRLIHHLPHSDSSWSFCILITCWQQMGMLFFCVCEIIFQFQKVWLKGDCKLCT